MATDPVGDLLTLLDIERLELDLFRGQSPDEEESQRVFGAGEAGGRDIRGRVHGGIVGQGDFALAGAVVSQPSRAQRQPI